MTQFRDPIFKGCTRPAMFLGIPLMPFLAVSGAFLLLAMWTLYLISPYVSLLLAGFYIPVFIIMQQVTRRDDQRLMQLLLRARMRHRHQKGRKFWGAISYSPLRFKRRMS